MVSDKIDNLTRMVDSLIQLNNSDKNLDDEAVDGYIKTVVAMSGAECSNEELAALKRNIQYKYQIYTVPGQSILADYEQENWYSDRKSEITPRFWNRYKNYLIDQKHFSPNVVSTLGEDTLDQKLMNYILDPKADYKSPVLKRGLIIGDVQSGKTSTYIGFLCKAADAGYKVFILLTGTIESLRKQTQERVEEGFIGIDSTYDVLMQMGRWFGYRKNYEDLFRIWTCKDSADWYAEIAEATDKLKDDMSLMRELGQKPRDFGIRVRNNSADLRITAYNKMRNSTDEYEFSSYYGGIVETPYLCYNAAAHINNYNEVVKLVNDSISAGISFERQTPSIGKGRYILQDVPKTRIIEFIRKLKISRFSSDFDVTQIAEFLRNSSDPLIEKFDVAFMDGNLIDGKISEIAGRTIYQVKRTRCIIDRDTDRLSLGRRGKLGGPNDGLAGIADYNGRKAEDIVAEAKTAFIRTYELTRQEKFTKDNFSSETWFRFVKDRKPLLIIYLIDVNGDEDERQKKQFDELKEKLGKVPVVGFALGLPRNDEAAALSATRYRANKIYNWFERDEMDIGDEE